MNEYRINKEGLFAEMSAWSSFLKRQVHLVACGGTAMTLLDIKESTKDIDFIVPDQKEFSYLTGKLTELGYTKATQYGWRRGNGFVYDLFPGNSVYTTELLDSPLAPEGNIKFKEFDKIYIGILNYYDIIITKLFRSTTVDIEDCIKLFKSRRAEIELDKLAGRFRQTASYDVSEDKVLGNYTNFISILKKEKLI